MSKLKRIFIILASIVFSMLVVPLIAINTAAPDAGMFICLLLFFVAYPALAIFIGILSGKDLKHFWFSPIILAVLFWIFATLTFTNAFPILYSAIYFAICSISEIITHLITKKQRH
ncbi:MAG: hypothetical protein IKU84_02380 [Clostridia bacterium]|nr:hypothetical protein [Clostridia bacterium]